MKNCTLTPFVLFVLPCAIQFVFVSDNVFASIALPHRQAGGIAIFNDLFGRIHFMEPDDLGNSHAATIHPVS